MGSSSSSSSKGSDNDELVDNLLKDQFLKTPSIQQIFRAVDRGLYFTKESRSHAYDNTEWRDGNIDLSAPGLYCEVLENLELGEGMSFLNLGSGTGYLNTMAGLILGSYGVNYGVEVHEEVIEYAYNRLDKFKRTAEAIDEYDFCEPKFFQGNCFQLSSENMLYDRVYCGSACPEVYENYMKFLIKINGILVMPLRQVLVKLKRTSETTWEKKSITPVIFFAPLIHPSPCDLCEPELMLSNPQPLSLQVICRSTIRRLLLKLIREENPKLKYHRIRKDYRFMKTRNGREFSAYLLKRDPRYRMLLYAAKMLRENEDDDGVESEYEESEYEDDDNSSREREDFEQDLSDEGMESSDKPTDEEEEDTSRFRKEDEEERVNGRAEEDEKPRFGGRNKRKKAHQSRTSSSDSDVEDMDVETAPTETSARTEKSVSESSTTGESSAERSSDGAGCSSNRNVSSSSESYDDRGSIPLTVFEQRMSQRKCGILHDMMMLHDRRMVIDRRIKKLQRFSGKGSDEEEQGRSQPPNETPSHGELMRKKIRALPLPPTIQSYLNFHRTF